MEAHAVGTVGVEPTMEETEFAQAIEAALPEGEGFTDNQLRVDYLLEKIAEEHAKASAVAEFTTRRMQMVRDHGEREIGQHHRNVRYLESKIRAAVPSTGRGMQEVFGKKSLTLPHGTVGYRASSETIVVEDPAKALAWAKAEGLEITVKESVGKTPLHAYIQRTGLIPELEECGFRLEPGGERWYVKVEGTA